MKNRHLISLSEALALFDLKANDIISKKEVNKRYRKLALKHHPDKGGDAKLFIKIAEAYQAILTNFNLTNDKTIFKTKDIDKIVVKLDEIILNGDKSKFFMYNK